MYAWGDHRRFNSYSGYFRRTFGGRVQKISVDAGFTCPNRDGKIGEGGCTFCNNGAFTPSYCVPAKGVRRQIEEGTLTFPELEKIRWNKVFAALDITFDGTVFEKYFRTALRESAIPVEGAKELLETLHSRYTLAAASNGPYEQQLHRLALAGMKDCFTYFFISERIGASKPSPLFFDAAFREVNEGREVPVTAAEAVIIGDSLTSDMAGGRGYGMKTVYYRRPGAAPANDSVDVTVEELRAIPALL